MSEPFLGQIMMVGFNFAPRGWAFCNGQLLSIASNSALFSILGTTYGGDGRTTFGLPDLRGRGPMHEGRGPGLTDKRLGQKGGEESHLLNVIELTQHAHGEATFSEVEVNAASGVADQKSPVGNSLAAADPTDVRLEEKGYSADAPDTPMAHNAVVLPSVGGGQPHENMPPFLAINFCIALVGTFPSRS